MRVGNAMKFASCCAMLLTAACIRHNVPAAGFTTTPGPSNVMRVFVDANGDFYPEHWERWFTQGGVERAHSLRLHPDPDNSRAAVLSRARAAQLAAVERLVADKSRVFVLIHGFNNSQKEAEDSYDTLRSRIPLTPGDAVIQFHWDGLVGSRGGQVPIWFNAAGYSQVAGTHALRPILNLIPGVDVYVITHSRGASVALSALGNPAYDPDFRARTTRLFGTEFFNAAPLVENGKRIHAIFLAPAIGRPDFWAEGCTANCAEYRTFSRQLKSIRHTVNPGDPVLKKLVGGKLPSSFNATDLGLEASVGDSLRARYPYLTGHLFHMEAHGFNEYARHEILATMLRESGVSVMP